MRPLDDRLVAFATDILTFVESAPRCSIMARVSDQLARCATSIGANYEEASAAESKPDFVHKMQVALKESRECCYWLKIVASSRNIPASSFNPLMREALELRAILSKAVVTAKSRAC